MTVILSRDGWLKRVREVKDLSATRLREGDAILAVIRGSTKEPMAIFSNFGSAYVLRINDVPASTGYGEPVQKLFNFRDGERVVGALSVSEKDAPKGTLAVAVSKNGFGLRFGFEAHRELSTRAGRRFAKPAEGDEIVGVTLAGDKDVVCVVTSDARALLCKAGEIPELANPGRGVTIIKAGEAAVVGFGVGAREGQGRDHRRDRRRQGAAGRSGPLLRHRARRQRSRAQAQDQDRARHRPLACAAGPLLN